MLLEAVELCYVHLDHTHRNAKQEAVVKSSVSGKVLEGFQRRTGLLEAPLHSASSSKQQHVSSI